MPPSLERIEQLSQLGSATPALELAVFGTWSGTARIERVAPGEVSVLLRMDRAALGGELSQLSRKLEASGLRVRALRVVAKRSLR